MSLGLNPLNASSFTLTGGLRPTVDGLRPDPGVFGDVRRADDDSTVATWTRLEDLRRQKAEAERDLQSLPRTIDRLRALMATLAAGTGKTVGDVLPAGAGPTSLAAYLDTASQGLSGVDLLVSADDDVATVLLRLQDGLNQLQFRLRQAPARIDEAGRETQRLQARLRQRDVDYDATTGGLTYTHTGQSIDPVDLLTRLWDKMKEARKVEVTPPDTDEPPTSTLDGLFALLASLYTDGKAPIPHTDGKGPQPLDPPQRQVRAYVTTQTVIAGGTGADGGTRVYQAKRPVYCDPDEVQAGGMASFVADTLIIGSRGPKELEVSQRVRQASGPTAFAAVVA